MAYVTPNNRILLLHNVPLDMEYENTMWWIDQATQTSTMQSFTKYTCAPTTYQRVNKNTVRVEHNADTLYDVNYMMFQNTNFGNKWFYAFVEKIDYINDAVSEITYRIDEIQTWYFDFTPMYSFVERCHSATDTIGDNIVDEPLEVGEYVANEFGHVTQFDDLCVMILVVSDAGGTVQSSDVKVFDNVLSGCTGYVFRYDNTASRQAINAYLDHYIASPDAVVAMYVLPQYMVVGVGSIPDAGMPIPNFSSSGLTLSGSSLPQIGNSTTLNGYTPKNNKMFTYPYNFLTVSNNNGQEANFRYEFFNNLSAILHIDFCASLPVSAKLYPQSYKGVSASTDYTFESLSIDNYPMCSWNADYYKAWVAQNCVPSMLAVGGSMVNQMSRAVRGGSFAHLSPINMATSLLGEAYQASIHANILKGNVQSGNVNIAHNKQSFFYARTSVNAQYAEIIDTYFTRYGYAQKKVMLPPRHNRSQFTYVKTVDCKISGSIPCDSEAIICEAFNRGITFWTNTANVGNYLVNNGLLT